jgi:hypothetical protein
VLTAEEIVLVIDDDDQVWRCRRRQRAHPGSDLLHRRNQTFVATDSIYATAPARPIPSGSAASARALGSAPLMRSGTARSLALLHSLLL